jgi:hypothetical protein
MSETPFRCSIASESTDERLVGTASTIRRWLLVEHGGPWGANALRDARLPEDVRTTLRRAERDLGIRVLLIRRPGRASSGPASAPAPAATVAAVDTGPEDPWMERTELADLGALTGKLDALGTGRSVGWPRSAEPFFVVCTQGRRDPCCAERGRPLAAALARGFPEATWEATHVGGDRFAGNLVIFPEGLYFGRVDPIDAMRVASTYADGRIDLNTFRGRSCHQMDVQAAEHAVRSEGGWDAIAAVSVGGVVRNGPITRVRLLTPEGPVLVTQERGSGALQRLTCHGGLASAPTYRVLAIEEETPTAG